MSGVVLKNQIEGAGIVESRECMFETHSVYFLSTVAQLKIF